MAEVQNASEGGRGRFRGGGGRKRRFREEEDETPHHGRRPPPYERGPRRRHDEPADRKIRRGLLSLGDPPRAPAEAVRRVARDLVDAWIDPDASAAAFHYLLLVVVEQPLRIPLAAAVVLRAGREKPDVAREVLERVGGRVNEAVRKGEWRAVKLGVRFLACLGRLCDGFGVVEVLETLFDRAADLQAASAEDAMGLELVRIILLTIPYLLVGAPVELQEDLRARVDALLEKTDIIASADPPLLGLVDPYPHAADGEARPMAAESVLSLLQKQLVAEREKGWAFATISGLFPLDDAEQNGGGGDDEGMKEPEQELTKHPFPTISIPEDINPGPTPLFPQIYFSIYADLDVPSVPPTSDIASSLIRDNLADTINALDCNRMQCAKLLIDMDCFFPPNTFTRRGMPFDKLRETPPGESTWKPEDMALDAIFAQIMQLPGPEHKLVYYHSIITETCRLQPGAIAPSLGRAIRFLYRNLGAMDLELNYRFMDWFSHHLSNFEYQWKWSEWVADVELPMIHPKKAFINGAINKEIRLSFAQRIRKAVPPEYHSLVPNIKEEEAPRFKYEHEDSPFRQHARDVVGAVRKRATETDVEPHLSAARELASTMPELDPVLTAIDIYVTAICLVGSKSLSHVLSCIERCKDRLLALGDEHPQARTHVVATVAAYWRAQPGVAVNIVDKLLNYGVVTPRAVVDWALDTDGSPPRVPASPDDFEPGSASFAAADPDTHAQLQAQAQDPTRLTRPAPNPLLDRPAAQHLALNWVFEMVWATTSKVTHRVRQIALALIAAPMQTPSGDSSSASEPASTAARGLAPEQRAVLADTLVRERAAMRELLAAVVERVKSETQGTGHDDDETDMQREKRRWAAKWSRVFERLSTVQDALVGEEAVERAVAEVEKQAQELAEAEAERERKMEEEGQGLGKDGAEDGDGERVNGKVKEMANGDDAVMAVE